MRWRYDGSCRRIINQQSDHPYRRMEPKVQTFSEALWFMLVTVTTTGYGRDGYPITYLGRCVMMITSIAGTLYLAMPLSVVSTKFFEIYTNMRELNKTKMLKRAESQRKLDAQKLAKERSSLDGGGGGGADTLPSWEKTEE